MLRIPDIRHQRHIRAFITALSVLLVATHAFSQSGRRPKPAPAEKPLPRSEDKQAPNVGARELPEKVSLIVGREFTSKHMLSEETILSNFIQRLKEFKNVDVITLGDSNRDRARKRATQETQAIVLLLQFDIDSFQKGTYILDSPDMDVRVLAFAPKSGQEKFKGKVYYKAQQGPMVKRDNWPGGTPIKITAEAVGVEAAEQVHDWLIVQSMRKRK